MRDLSNENVIHEKKDGIEYLQFRKLLEYSNIISHAYSLGIDKNFRTSTPKNDGKIIKEQYLEAISNYKKLCNTLGMNGEEIYKVNQKHSSNIEIMKKDNKKVGFPCGKEDINDGVITNVPQTVLATTNADCILLLFFDPVQKVIANVHSGWRGTLQRISVEAVKSMQKEYNCNPEDIICCICPSIRKCHFEVREDVQKMFEQEFKDMDNIIEKVPNTDKWTIDTVEINKVILEQSGLKKENIIDSKICSVCNSDLVHSYRVEKEGYGLSTALIELK